MLVDKFLPLIREKLIQLYGTQTLADNATREQMLNFVNENIKLSQRFKPLLEPNNYLQCVFELLNMNGSASIKQIMDHFYIFYVDQSLIGTDKEPQEKSVHKAISRALGALYNFGLVTTHVIPYTRTQTQMYRAIFSTEEQFEFALKFYEGYEAGYYERLIKHIVYEHNKGKKNEKDQPEKIGEKIVKDELIKIAKERVKRELKKVSSQKFYCCGNEFKTQIDLEKHWKTKYSIAVSDHKIISNDENGNEIIHTIKKGDKICLNCDGISWDECEIHNCEKKYWLEKKQIKEELENIINATSENLLPYFESETPKLPEKIPEEDK